MQYRCYFFGANGQLVGAQTIIQEGEVEACNMARRLFAQRAYATGYDLREGKRSIETYDVMTAKATKATRAA